MARGPFPIKAWAQMIAGIAFLFGAIALARYNVRVDENAAQESALILTKVEAATSEAELDSLTPLMPVISIDGKDYIGQLHAESVGIDLPILAVWDEDDSLIAPCRYTGSAYDDTMVLCGHNMRSQFYPINEFQTGDEVVFTDVNGNVFRYAVAQIYNLKPGDVSEMLSGDWDLTLFTCNFSGSARVTVRCTRIKE